QIASAINIIVHVSRLSDGSRKVMKISEISGMEGEMIMMQDLFEFVRADTTAAGKINGAFQSTGIPSGVHTAPENTGQKTGAKGSKAGCAITPDLLIRV